MSQLSLKNYLSILSTSIVIVISGLSSGCFKDDLTPDVSSGVYVAGFVQKGNYHAVIAKNGSAVPLTEEYSGASAITISGMDIYVVGEIVGAKRFVATYWKNLGEWQSCK